MEELRLLLVCLNFLLFYMKRKQMQNRLMLDIVSRISGYQNGPGYVGLLCIQHRIHLNRQRRRVAQIIQRINDGLEPGRYALIFKQNFKHLKIKKIL